MKKVFPSVVLRTLLAFWVFSPTFVYAQGAVQLFNKIAFLRGQSVWVANPDGSNAHKFTSASVPVNEFLFSPSLRYLACSEVVGSAEEPGLWDSTETAPQRAICSIVILDLKAQRTLKQTDSEWVYIHRWIPQDRLLYYTSDGYAVGDSYIYDVHSGFVSNIGINDDRPSDSEFSSDGSLELYVDRKYVDKHNRYDLHCVDKTKNTDTVLLTRDYDIMDQRISHSKKMVAFLQVQDVDHKYTDVLSLFDLHNSSCVSLHRGPSHSNFSGVNYLAWSFDDQYLGLFFSEEAIVLDVRRPSKAATIAGSDFSWIGNDKFIYTRSKCIYLYDLATRSSKMIIRNADQCTFLREPME